MGEQALLIPLLCCPRAEEMSCLRPNRGLQTDTASIARINTRRIARQHHSITNTLIFTLIHHFERQDVHLSMPVRLDARDARHRS